MLNIWFLDDMMKKEDCFSFLQNQGATGLHCEQQCEDDIPGFRFLLPYSVSQILSAVFKETN